ncbi:hypothetical protein IWQ57_004142, partial [Coemansia nantahalensis]
AETPTSALGFTLSRHTARHRALAEAHATSGSVSATAACFPPSAMQTPASFADAREAASLRPTRLSYGGAPRHDDALAVADALGCEGDDARQFGSLTSTPIHRNLSTPSAAEDKTAETAELPNAVEQLRYRCAESLALMPKIFDPSRPATGSVSAAPDTAGDATPTAPAPADTPSPDGDADAPASIGSGKVFIGSAQSPAVAAAGNDSPGQHDESGAPTAKPGSASSSIDFDLAGAVAAAAEKVMNDKTWEQPDNCLLLPAKKSARRKTRAARAAPKERRGSGSSGESQPMFDAEEGDSSDRSNSSSKRSSESSHYSQMDRSEIENAINRLAPIRQPADLQIETGELDDMMQGMEFFDAQDAGPELTGLLSADPDKLTFGDAHLGGALAAIATADDAAAHETTAAPQSQSPEAEAEAEAEAAAESSGQAQARSRLSSRFGWKLLTPPPPPPPQLTTVLRRSISMPDGTGSAELRQADAPESAEPEPEPTIAQSAHEPREYKGVLVRKSRLSGVMPTAVLSAMSSPARLGAASRANMLRTIGSRMSAWFTKK